MKVYWGSPEKEKSGELIDIVNYARPAGKRMGHWLESRKFKSPHVRVLYTHPMGDTEVLHVRKTKIRTNSLRKEQS